MNILALDPSINHLGWVLMSSGKVLGSGTINAPTEFKQEELIYRLDWMMAELDDLPCSSAEVIAIERPEQWGAYKSMASSRSGSLQVLTLLVGTLTAWALCRVGADNVHLVKVSAHKGQLPKHITQRRMEQKYHCKFASDHEADACSVGNHILTKENNGTKKR